MRLSQRADYAAHAMVEIARWYGERPVHATEIAQRQGIPEPYLEQLLLALRRAALVRSYRGPGGGYTLTRPPGAISLADIVAALEGPFVPPEEGLHDSEGGDDPLTCPIRDAWHPPVRADTPPNPSPDVFPGFVNIPTYHNPVTIWFRLGLSAPMLSRG